jgi:hypothetical protein
LRFKSIYDYNEEEANEYPNKIIRAVKYVEIISKSLISHNINLELEEKREIIDLMYSVPNKVLYAMFSPFDMHFDEVIDELKAVADSVSEPPQEMSRQDVENIFIQVAVSICLGLYDKIAFHGSNSETLRLLNVFEMTNSNHRVMNLLMEENGGTSLTFADKAILLKEEEKDSFITDLVMRIARKHLLTRSVDFRTKQRIADKIFPPLAKKSLLVNSMLKEKNK